MHISKQIASHLRGVFFGGNWTWVNMQDTLQGITWQQSNEKVGSFNTIAVLVYHTNYYVNAILHVLQGHPLTAHDKYAFDCPPITDEASWELLVNKSMTEATALAALIEELPDEKLGEIFAEEKYGTYYRNLHGLIEHTHYHLGQISLLKKMLLEKS
jgi:hypothetical protein